MTRRKRTYHSDAQMLIILAILICMLAGCATGPRALPGAKAAPSIIAKEGASVDSRITQTVKTVMADMGANQAALEETRSSQRALEQARRNAVWVGLLLLMFLTDTPKMNPLVRVALFVGVAILMVGPYLYTIFQGTV